MKLKEQHDSIIKKYNAFQTERKGKIFEEPNKWKRFWKWVWFYITFPFVWIFYNIRDITTAIIFVIVFLIVSSEIWIPYLIGFICWYNEPLRIAMFSFGSACRLFWLGPFTPFLAIVISLTMLIKELINKLKK